MAMCPLVSSRDMHATCGRSEDGARVPSAFEKAQYCFDTYELCPLFSMSIMDEYIRSDDLAAEAAGGYNAPSRYRQC